MRGSFVIELLDAGQVAAYNDIRVRLLNPHHSGIALDGRIILLVPASEIDICSQNI
jgi:hypothetical protein